MPRLPRLDAPGAVHHVMGRGIEGGVIFVDDTDREDFLARVACLVRDGAICVYAWALMLNHFHLLMRSLAQPLGRSMRSLLTGYAVNFNRRHQRVGHLFQNRYKSVLVQEERYLLKLVHYVHRNPIPKLVANERRLATYPWTGHSTILGTRVRDWQDVGAVLARFDDNPVTARRCYRRFLESPRFGAHPDLDGGGLVRSMGGWKFVSELPRGRERFTSDERILGVGSFVSKALEAAGDASGRSDGPPEMAEVVELVARACGIPAEALRAKGRSRDATEARAGVAHLWVDRFGQSANQLASFLGLAKSSVHAAIRRGRSRAADWNRVVDTLLAGAASPPRP